jgi:hypothetical protein
MARAMDAVPAAPTSAASSAAPPPPPPPMLKEGSPTVRSEISRRRQDGIPNRLGFEALHAIVPKISVLRIGLKIR